jgi:hypothetical protein
MNAHPGSNRGRTRLSGKFNFVALTNIEFGIAEAVGSDQVQTFPQGGNTGFPVPAGGLFKLPPSSCYGSIT